MSRTAVGIQGATHAPPAHVDVLIVGAGISGIGAGAHLRQTSPSRSFAIIESREKIGGTWSLFQYPGIRSDSDLQTFGYAFKPWTNEQVIAPAADILDYLEETVEDYQLEETIHFGYRVLVADFSSTDGLWHVRLGHGDGDELDVTASFIFSATGYYNYDQGYLPAFPDADRFAGQIIHPQHWPEDLNYSGKRVVVIGSGATAMTLLPAMADAAEHVTMLQRSPTYVISLPARDPVIGLLGKVLPEGVAFTIARGMNIKRQSIFYDLCKSAPGVMKRLLTLQAKLQLPKGFPVNPTFTPTYNPWDERLCVVPNGDLFRSLRHGTTSIVTDRIRRFVPDGIELESGTILEADIVVSATGLNLLALGGVALSIDSEPVDLSTRVAYKGMMLSGVPNIAFAIGYTNASWTLKVDLVCEHFCKLLNHMRRTGENVFVPEAPEGLELRPLLDFQAGYVQRAVDQFPRQATTGPWTMPMSYAQDRKRLIDGPVTDPALKLSHVQTPETVGA